MKMTLTSAPFATLLVLLFSIPNPATAKDDAMTDEIGQLIEHIQASDCRFNRNGSWYEPVEAADHLNKKYRYVQKRGLVDTAEDFIEIAATRSSISGKEYVVQCEGAKPRKSADWLTGVLAQLRQIQH